VLVTLPAESKNRRVLWVPIDKVRLACWQEVGWEALDLGSIVRDGKVSCCIFWGPVWVAELTGTCWKCVHTEKHQSPTGFQRIWPVPLHLQALQ
jgi:hypothetical protein